MTSFKFVCEACGNVSDQLLKPKMNHYLRCPSCSNFGRYWHNQFDWNYKSPERAEVCLVVNCFWPDRLSKFLKYFETYEEGIPYDLVFVHNVFDKHDVVNRQARTDAQINEVRRHISNLNLNSKTLIERDNVGEDLGASRHVFNLLCDNYKYFFFINEVSEILCDNWLKKFIDVMKSDNRVVACGPKVIRKNDNKFKYIICSTYWGLDSSFGKRLIWPPPTNRAESKAQEMQLLWPQAKALGYNIAQVGSGDDILHYSNVPATSTVGEGIY